MKKHILLFIIIIGCFTIQAQKKQKLNIFTFDEVEKLQQQNPKPIFVFVYTNWCKICFGMKKTTFKNQEVIKILNNNFYFVQFDGEEKKSIRFLNRKFNYKPSGNKTGIHELALELASVKGKISFPTSIILNPKNVIDLQIQGFINSKKMIFLLKNI